MIHLETLKKIVTIVILELLSNQMLTVLCKFDRVRVNKMNLYMLYIYYM